MLFCTDFISRDRARPLTWTDSALMRLWPAQYIWCMFNPDIAIATHVNFGVILLSGVAGLLIGRAGRNSEATSIVAPEFTSFEPQRAAA